MQHFDENISSHTLLRGASKVVALIPPARTCEREVAHFSSILSHSIGSIDRPLHMITSFTLVSNDDAGSVVLYHARGALVLA